VPLIVAPARDSKALAASRGRRCAEPVSLLDLYPTLIELSSLPPRADLSGHSLVPLLENPAQTTGRVVLTTFGKGNYSVMGQHWHYIRYEDGSDELYDRAADPHEWTNLAAMPEHAEQKASLAKHLPKDSATPSANSSKPAKKKSSDL
jgi:arylsulfatase A-like enzyme